MATSKTGFQLQCPIVATPQFETKQFNLSWRLQVEFVINMSDLIDDDVSDGEQQKSVQGCVLELKRHNNAGSEWVSQNVLDVETFECTIPLNIIPTNQDIPTSIHAKLAKYGLPL